MAGSEHPEVNQKPRMIDPDKLVRLRLLLRQEQAVLKHCLVDWELKLKSDQAGSVRQVADQSPGTPHQVVDQCRQFRQVVDRNLDTPYQAVDQCPLANQKQQTIELECRMAGWKARPKADQVN